MEPSPSCLPVFLISFLPSPSTRAASSPPCFVLRRKEMDCPCRWGQRCFFSPESNRICLLFSAKPCFLEANLGDRNPNSEKGSACEIFRSTQGKSLCPRNGFVRASTWKPLRQFLCQLFHVVRILYLYQAAISGQCNIFHF